MPLVKEKKKQLNLTSGPAVNEDWLQDLHNLKLEVVLHNLKLVYWKFQHIMAYANLLR